MSALENDALLMISGTWPRHRLVGVAVFPHPCRKGALTSTIVVKARELVSVAAPMRSTDSCAPQLRGYEASDVALDKLLVQ